MRKCCICSHENKYRAGARATNRSMFHLPQKEILRNEWLKLIPERLKYLKTLVVCEVHFSKGDFQPHLDGYKDARKRLLSTAVPNRNLGAMDKTDMNVSNNSNQSLNSNLDPANNTISGRKIYVRKRQEGKSFEEPPTNESEKPSDSDVTDHNYYSSLKDNMQLDTTKLIASKALRMTTMKLPTRDTSEFTALSKNKSYCSTEKQLLVEEAETKTADIEETLACFSKQSGLEREKVMKLNIISKLPPGWFELVPSSFIRTFIEHVNVPGENTRLAIRSFKINAELTAVAEYVLDYLYRPPAQFSNEKELFDIIERFVSLPLCSGVPNEQYEDVPLPVVSWSFYGNVWRSKTCCRIAIKGPSLCRSCHKLKASLKSKITDSPNRRKNCTRKEQNDENILQ